MNCSRCPQGKLEGMINAPCNKLQVFVIWVGVVTGNIKVRKDAMNMQTGLLAYRGRPEYPNDRYPVYGTRTESRVAGIQVLYRGRSVVLY